jgi:LacI family transcriptional regulator
MSARSPLIRVALVLPTEFASARDVLHGIIAATRERNMYGREAPRQLKGAVAPGLGPVASATLLKRSWQFRVFRGSYARSVRYLGRWFNDWNPDGIICQVQEERLLKFFRDTGKPIVEVFERNGPAVFPRVLPDDLAAGRLAADHFLQRGFRNFGFFGDGGLPWSREREVGFREQIERVLTAREPKTSNRSDTNGAASGEPVRRRRSGGAGNAGGRFTFSTFEREGRSVAAALGGSHRRQSAAMGEWLASMPRPVAVLAANDLWGFELVQAAREWGLHVPDDVAILGVDNDELLCEVSHPPLSSIVIGGEQMGREAVALLEKMLRRTRQDPPEPARVPPLGIVTRQSSDVLAVEDPEVAAALRHIRSHAFEGLSVKQMLDALAVNRRTLERRFVKILGHTPLEEIRRVRMERVKALLQTDLPIYEVAVRSGYATPEYLATSFLQVTGLSPTEYRRKFAPRGRWDNLPA